jgi:hypothetical protein
MKLLLACALLWPVAANAGPHIDVDVGGGPLPFASAFVWHTANGALAFDISNEKHATCDSVRDAHRTHGKNEDNLAGTIEDALLPDGKSAKNLHTLMFVDEDLLADVPVKVTGSGKSMTIAFDFKRSHRGAAGPFDLSAKGSVVAKVCPAAPAPKDLDPLPAEMPATIELAGKKLAVRGAHLQSAGDTRALILLTGGEACKESSRDVRSELIVGLVWDKAADQTITTINLAGRWMAGIQRQVVSVAHAAPASDGEVEVHVTAKVAGYPVKIDGKVKPVACK